MSSTSDSASTSASGGRPKLDFLHKYFDFDAANNKSICKIGGCTTKITGKPAGNLERHLKCKHVAEYADVSSQRDALQLTRCASPQPQKRKSSETLTIKMNWESVKRAAVTLCTVNGRPLSVVEDSGMRMLLDPILAALNSTGFGRLKNVNRQNVARFISEEAERTREEIRKEIQGKLVCIKIDTASRMDRRVLGINIQYAHGGKLVIRPVAMVETTGSHTAEYIRDLVLKSLEPFGIGARNIYTGTCDNGSNVKKAISLLGEVSRHELGSLEMESPDCFHHSQIFLPPSERDEQDDDPDGDLLGLGQLAQCGLSSSSLSLSFAENPSQPDEGDDEDGHGAIGQDWSDSESEGENSQHQTSSSSEGETAVTEADTLSPTHTVPTSCSDCSALKTALADMGIKVVACAAHTMQLAVADSLKATPSTRVILQKARKLAKALRAPLHSGRLKAMGLPKAFLDVETRWNSTHAMLSRLLLLRQACCDISEEQQQHQQAKRRRTRASRPPKDDKVLPNLTPSEWDSVEAYCSNLQPAKVATMLFQREQLTVGDCFAAWLRCEEATKKMTTTLAKNLVTCMSSRRKELLKTEAFAPGIFMDPRYNSLLSPEEKATAIAFLEALWIRLNREPEPEEGATADSDEAVQQVESPEEEEDSLERLLRDNEAAAACAAREPLKSVSGLLHEYSKWKRVAQEENVLQFWESRKNSHPELYALAMVALSVPMTQVSVERTFSHLRQILSILRYNLSAPIINDIILLKCNAAFAQ